MSAFLPTNYTVPETKSEGGGLYMKLEQGENKIRILTAPLTGWQYWTNDDKSIRLRKQPNFRPYNMRGQNKWGNPEKVKHFWCLVVWDYATESIRLLEITQATIQEGIATLNADEDWGDPREYNLKIVKTGEKMETEYRVIPARPQPLSEQIKEKIAENPIDLNATYFAVNPTKTDWKDEARTNIYDRLNTIYQDAASKGVNIDPIDLPNTALREILIHYEDCLMKVSTGIPSTPNIQDQPDLGESENLDSIPF